MCSFQPAENPPTSNCYKCGYRETSWGEPFPLCRPCPKCGFLYQHSNPAHFKLLEDYVEWEKKDLDRRLEEKRNQGCLVFVVPIIASGVALYLQ